MPAPKRVHEKICEMVGDENNSGYIDGSGYVTSVTDVTNVTQTTENLTKSVEDWLEFCDGVFTFKELAWELQLSSTINPKKLNTLKQIIKRLIDAKRLVRVGDRKGVYRKVEQDLEEMRWWEEDEESDYPLDLPLELSCLCRLFPRNIIVFAGSKSSGKTALSLNVARMNIGRVKTHYFTSEMHKAELVGRLKEFKTMPLEKWRAVSFYDKDRDFQDYISRFPNDFHIIDFLEIHDEFWKVGATIRAIYDSLKDGCALINLQKKADQEFARGGEMTLEKARLYLSLTKQLDNYGIPFTRAKIVDAKTPRNPMNKPTGMIRDYRINYGWRIDPMNEWHREFKSGGGNGRRPQDI